MYYNSFSNTNPTSRMPLKASIILLLVSSFTVSLNEKPNEDNNGAGGVLGGCAAVVGGGVAAGGAKALAKGGCSGLSKGAATKVAGTLGKAAAPKITATTAAKVGIGSGIAGESGANAIRAAGKDYLKTTDATTLLGERELLNEVPGLESALRSGMSMETFLANDPSAAFQAGTYLIRKDRELFAKMLSVKYRTVPGAIGQSAERETYEKANMEATLNNEADLLAKRLAQSGAINPDILRTETTILANRSGQYRQEITVDGMYVNIHLYNERYSYSARIDFASAASKVAGGKVSYEIADKLFTLTSSPQDNSDSKH